jgi:hypothetical protein
VGFFLFFCKKFAESPGALTAKEPFAVYMFAMKAFPRAAHDKLFTESEPAFAVRNRLTAKLAFL